jgi:hypothetical protein
MRVAICADCVRTLEPQALSGAATLPTHSFEVTAEWLTQQGGGVTLGEDERPPGAAPDGCSFCGLAPSDVAHLFGSQLGPSQICDACIRLSLEILEEEDG